MVKGILDEPEQRVRLEYLAQKDLKVQMDHQELMGTQVPMAVTDHLGWMDPMASLVSEDKEDHKVYLVSLEKMVVLDLLDYLVNQG